MVSPDPAPCRRPGKGRCLSYQVLQPGPPAGGCRALSGGLVIACRQKAEDCLDEIDEVEVERQARWLVIQTEPNREQVAVNYLKAPWCGRTVYLPLIVVSHVIRSRLVSMVRPLFPRYVFVKDDPDYCMSRLKSVPAVHGPLIVAGRAARLSHDIIADIELRCQRTVVDCSPFRPGEHVRTQNGLDAVFVERDGATRAWLLIQMFSREIRTLVPIGSLQSLQGLEA